MNLAVTTFLSGYRTLNEAFNNGDQRFYAYIQGEVGGKVVGVGRLLMHWRMLRLRERHLKPQSSLVRFRGTWPGKEVELFRLRQVSAIEAAVCQSDMTEMVNAAVFPISRCGQRNARRAPNPSAAVSNQKMMCIRAVRCGQGTGRFTLGQRLRQPSLFVRSRSAPDGQFARRFTVDTSADAREIALVAHHGQVDKSGRPYFDHVQRVANGVDGHDEKIVAYLHDVVEKSENWTLDRLAEEGFSVEIVAAVDVNAPGERRLGGIRAQGCS